MTSYYNISLFLSHSIHHTCKQIRIYCIIRIDKCYKFSFCIFDSAISGFTYATIFLMNHLNSMIFQSYFIAFLSCFNI